MGVSCFVYNVNYRQDCNTIEIVDSYKGRIFFLPFIFYTQLLIILHFVGYNSYRVIKMSLFIRTVQKEKERIDYMLSKYLQQLKELPKGSITAKSVGTNTYYYLKYRNGKKVFTKYLGKDGEQVQRVCTELERRNHIEAMVAHLRIEQSLVDKVLEE